MKKSKHDLLELVEKLINSIEFRNPGKKVNDTEKSLLYTKWQGKEDELYSFVKTLGINEHKAKTIKDKQEFHEVEFQIGVSLSGEPIIVKHVIERLNEFKKPIGRYTKKPKGNFLVKSKAYISRTFF